MTTADVAWAAALDHAYGWANAPRHRPSPDDRNDALWDKFRELLGDPPEDELMGVMWEHREAITRMNLRVIAHSLRGSAATNFVAAPAESPAQGELPLVPSGGVVVG